MTEGRRTFGPVVALGVAAAVLAAVAAARPWVRLAEPGDSSLVIPVATEDGEMALAAAVSLVLLASWGVVLVTRGVVRRLVAGDEVVCEWRPEPHHEAFEGVLNGGICGTLLDCHSNWTAAHHLMERLGEATPPCTVTAEFHVKLKRPTPMDGAVQLRARVVSATDEQAEVEATLEAGGKLRATCRGVFVAVKPGHPAYHRW